MERCPPFKGPALALLVSVVCMSGCTAISVLPADRRDAARPSDAWSQVYLVRVKGAVDSSPGGEYSLLVPPGRALEDVLRERLGRGCGDGTRPVALLVENVRAVTPGDHLLGLAADFILRRGGQARLIRLEHSVDAPSGDSSAVEALYTRALYDLTDHLFCHPEAMAFLERGAVAPMDSAGIDEPVEHGPLLPMKPSSEGLEATGRVLWGSYEHDANYVLSLFLGKAVGVMGLGRSSYSNKHLKFSGLFGLGGMKAKDTSMFSIMASIFLGAGYAGAYHDDDGNILSPGLTFFIGPLLDSFNMMASEFSMGTIMYGGRAEVDVPIGQRFGATAGAFVGASTYFITATGVSMSGTSFVWFPAVDVYYQSATGRISIGLAFQALADMGSILKNPVITLTWQEHSGRGMAYSKTSLGFSDIPLYDDAEVLSGPRSAFVDGSAPPAPKSAELPEVRGSGDAVAGPPAAEVLPAPAARSAGPLGLPAGAKLLVADLVVDPALGSEVASEYVASCRAAVAASRGTLVLQTDLQSDMAIAGFTGLKTLDQIAKAAEAVGATHRLSGTATSSSEEMLTIRLWLTDIKEKRSRMKEWTVKKVAMVPALREMVRGFLP